MLKKKGNDSSSDHHLTKHRHHPVFRQKLTRAQKAADVIARFGGSWTFISLFLLFLVTWMIIQSVLLLNKGFDPYPYILLNLTLSCIAAIQAPVILMSQNREAERERINAAYDHAINRKAEREIQQLQKEIKTIHNHLLEIRKIK